MYILSKSRPRRAGLVSHYFWSILPSPQRIPWKLADNGPGGGVNRQNTEIDLGTAYFLPKVGDLPESFVKISAAG
jgi:hypothetical protein